MRRLAMNKYGIEGIPFQVQMVKHLHYADDCNCGELALVEYNSLIFEAHFDDLLVTKQGLFRSIQTETIHNEARFLPGRVLEVVCHLESDNKSRDIMLMSEKSPKSIIYKGDNYKGGKYPDDDFSVGDWIITGETKSEVKGDFVMIDCGIPALCEWDRDWDPVPCGTLLRMERRLELIPTEGWTLIFKSLSE